MISARHPNWSEWLAFDRLALLAVDWTALCPRLPWHSSHLFSLNIDIELTDDNYFMKVVSR